MQGLNSTLASDLSSSATTAQNGVSPDATGISTAVSTSPTSSTSTVEATRWLQALQAYGAQTSSSDPALM